jgi:two-component system sensor histidine kinase VicK
VKVCIEELKPEIVHKQLKVTELYTQDISCIQADPKLLKIIFQNLLTNAVKYTPQKGEIQITIGSKGDDILVTVQDTGIGIPEQQKKNIFDKLFRADNSRKIDPDGTGLGLYIVNEILTATGGKVWFESRENHGTTFFFTVPKIGMQKKGGVRQLI